MHEYVDSNNDWYVYVYRYSDGEYIELSCTSIGLNGNEKVTIPYIGAVKNGIYYIKVSKNWGNGVVGKNYTVKTSFDNSDYFEKETNNVYSTASLVKLNASYSGNINNANDVDYYKISTSSNGKISINFKHEYVDSNYSWYVYVYRYNDGEYKELSCTSIVLNGNEKVTIPYVGAVKNGIYYIKVSRNWGTGVVGKNYTIDISFSKSEFYEKEVNNVFGTATKITSDNSYSGNINNLYDDDYYKITAPITGKVQISFKHEVVDSYDEWDVIVYCYNNGEYTQISSMNIEQKSNGTIELPFIGVVRNKEYYIKVSKGWGAGVIGKNYTIMVKSFMQPMTKISAKSGKKKVVLSWKKITGAYYQVQIKKGGKYKTLKTVKGKKYSVNNLSPKKKYTLRVRYYKVSKGKKYYSEWKKVVVKTK